MIDFERFRLRRFMDMLVDAGECLVINEPVDLIDVAQRLDGEPRAVWFKAVGPERAELVGNVCGSRGRLALAFDVSPIEVPLRMRDRMAHLHQPVEVSSAEAPVHQVVKTGADASFYDLPIHLQHGWDGAPYISASMDFARNPTTGGTNIGVRRMMLRGGQEAGIDLVAPSDLRIIYSAAAEAERRVEVAYVVGSHPVDLLAGTASARVPDEMALMGALRGQSVPVVRCKTIDVMVPADAEYVFEGYLDGAEPLEPEGPYGEFLGYYGEIKHNPIFHLTAITHRSDALFQTASIGGYHLGKTDTAQLVAAKTEATIWRALEIAVREPVAVCCTASSGGIFNVRVAINQRYPGEARNAIHAVFASLADVKHVFIVDPDIDVFDDGQIDWAFATRCQADRDIVLASGLRAVPIDPSLGPTRTGGKVGFDCTWPGGLGKSLSSVVPNAPVLAPTPFGSALEALEHGPASFLEMMAAEGSRDGRDVVRILEPLHAARRLTRDPLGRYCLAPNGGGSQASQEGTR